MNQNFNNRESALFSVEFQTPLGPIRGEAQIDTGPMGLIDLAPTAYELTKIFVERTNRRVERAGRKVSCGPECGVCCSQMVALSTPEVFFLVDLVESFQLQRSEEMVRRFEK